MFLLHKLLLRYNKLWIEIRKKHLIFSPKIVKIMGVGSGFLASQNGKGRITENAHKCIFFAVLVGMEYIYIYIVLPCILQYKITKSKKSGR